jgi:hypothetical protein
VAAGRRNDTNGAQQPAAPHLTAPSLNGALQRNEVYNN